MSLLCSDILLAGFPSTTPVHLRSPSSTDAGRSVPSSPCMFFAVYSSFAFTWKKLHLSSWCYRFKTVIQQHIEVQRAERFLPFLNMTVSGIVWIQSTQTRWPKWRLCDLRRLQIYGQEHRWHHVTTCCWKGDNAGCFWSFQIASHSRTSPDWFSGF